MHSKAEEDAKKAQQIHYDGILQEAESRAVYQGIGYGVGASFLTGLGLKYAEARGSKRLTPYSRGVVVCLSGLIVSQLMAHFLYLGASNQVTFERRRDAAQKAEDKKQRMLQDWARDQEARKTLST